MRRVSFPQAPAQVDASCDFTDVLFNTETICRKLVWIWGFSPLLHPQAQCPPLQRRVSPFWLLSFNPHWVTGARLCSEMTPCSTSPVIFPNTSVRTYCIFLSYSCISWLETMISEIQKAKSSVLLSTFFAEFRPFREIISSLCTLSRLGILSFVLWWIRHSKSQFITF